MLNLKQKLQQAQNVLKSKESQLNALELKLKASKQQKSLASLEDERDQLLDDIRHLNEKLRKYRDQQTEAKVK